MCDILVVCISVVYISVLSVDTLESIVDPSIINVILVSIRIRIRIEIPIRRSQHVVEHLIGSISNRY